MVDDGLAPLDVKSLLAQGRQAQRARDAAQAQELFLMAESMAPDDIRPKLAIAGLFLDAGEAKRAAGVLDRVLARAPDDPDVTLLAAKTEFLSGADADAVRRLAHARTRHPDNAEIAYALGAALTDLGLADHAIDHLDAAMARMTDAEALLEARIVKGAALLATGRTAEGWPLFGDKTRSPRQTAQIDAPGVAHWWEPGDPPPEGRVLVAPVDGVGDEILTGHLIAHFAASLAARGGTLTLACDSRLKDVFADAFPDVAVTAFVDERGDGRTIRRLEETAETAFDVGVAAAHLPLLTDPDVAGATRPAYWPIDEARVAAMRAVFHGEGPLIGLAWSSSMATGERARHYPSAVAVAEMTAIRGARFVSLQYDAREADFAAFAGLGLDVRRVGDLDLRNDFAGLAHLCAACDAVAGVANASTATAVATGRPTFLVARERHWSLLGRRDGTYPWSPAARIVTRDEAGHKHAWAKLARAVGDHVGRS